MYHSLTFPTGGLHFPLHLRAPPGLQFNQVLSIKPKCRVCRHPEDRVPPHTSSKSRQGARWAPTLPRVPCLSALPHREESSGATTYSSAPDLASLPRWASMLPRGPNLASPRGELRCCHVPHGHQRVVDHRNKERPNCLRHTTELTCV
jgi:hypothetical protein